jgi:UDP-N-acetylmuramoylalanine--D-glutamate ligase
MKNTDFFKGKKVTIVGLARSGLACANLLFDLGAEVTVTDCQDNSQTRANASKLKSEKIRLELGKHTREFIHGRDFVVISPGVPDNAPPLVWAAQCGIPLLSEIEVAWILCPAKVIAVTGSNGKTTVTTLIGKVIQASGKKVFVCGNIGNPFCGELAGMEEGDFVSLEVSSFQLETIRNFKPYISVILNFSRNHLDRYANMQEYFDAKKRIFMNQDSADYLILNQDDPVSKELAQDARAQVVYFSKSSEFNPNQSAVFTVGSILGIDKNTMVGVFNEFKGIEHRMEEVAVINNIRFINDSKATTVESAMWALKSVSSPAVLIAGGKDKGLEYSFVLDSARQKVKEVILIGEAKKKIAEAFKGVLPVEEAPTLEEAVTKAFSKAKPGECVLFSPMCSSFDMFANYEERGRAFKKIVKDLAEKHRPIETIKS